MLKKYEEIKNLNETQTSQEKLFKEKEDKLNFENEELINQNEKLINFKLRSIELENTIKEFQNQQELLLKNEKENLHNLEAKLSEITNVRVFFYGYFL